MIPYENRPCCQQHSETVEGKQVNRPSSSGATVIMVTHDMDLVAQHATRVIVLDKGKVILDFPPKQIFTHGKAILESVKLAPPGMLEITDFLGEEGCVETFQKLAANLFMNKPGIKVQETIKQRGKTLMVTCGWIVYEATGRLFFRTVEVEVNFWSFLIMGMSIGVDISRSRMLSDVAKKYNSQALEADALQFSTDIWSSAVVVTGLTLTLISERMKLAWLAKADAVAAMGVAGIVVYVSLQLGRRAVGNLIDEISPTMLEAITKAAQVPGVLEVQHVRARQSGPEIFADLTICINREATFEQAHEIAARVEEAVQGVAPQSTVVVHMDPLPMGAPATGIHSPKRERRRRGFRSQSQ